MNGRTTSIVALLTLALGSGAGYWKFVMPAVDERNKQQSQFQSLSGQADQLNKEVDDLRKSLNGMAMGTISYFDLTAETNKRRIMEAKTVETLASITEIFNDNHVKVVSMDPKGESTGLNKPAPPPPTPKPGETPPPAAATPTPQPGATTPPPPIQLTHKQFGFELQGEYGDLVNALREIQALPRAISINDYRLKLVNEGSATTGMPAAGSNTSPSALSLNFDLSITFLMDTAGNVAAPSPEGHAANLLAHLGDWVCPPAFAAEAAPRTHLPTPRTAVRPLDAVKAVSWNVDGLELHTLSGVTPAYRVVGHRRGLLVIELQHTVTRAPIYFHAKGHGVKQVVALPAPHNPLATHLAITTDPDMTLRLAELPNRRLHVVVETPAQTAVHAAEQAVAVKPEPRPTPQLVALTPPHLAAVVTPQVAATPIAVKPARHEAPVTIPVPMPAAEAPLKVVVKPHGDLDEATAPALDVDHVPTETARSWDEQRLSQLAGEAGHGAKRMAVPDVDEPEAAHGALAAGPSHVQTVIAVPSPADPSTPHPARAHKVLPPAIKPVAVPLDVAAELAPLTAPKPAARPAHRATAFEPPLAAVPTRFAHTTPARATITYPEAAHPAVARVAASPEERTHLDAVRMENGELVIETSGAEPRLTVLGGSRNLLLLSVDELALGGHAQLFPVGQAGIKQVRAALFDNRTMTTHLAIDTDGSVRLHLVPHPGQIRLRMEPMDGAKAAARPAPHVAAAPARRYPWSAGASVTADVNTDAPELTPDGAANNGLAPRPAPSKHPLQHLFPLLSTAATHPYAAHHVVAAFSHGAPKPVAAAPQPTATPTPMAVPAPHAVPAKPAPRPALASPKPIGGASAPQHPAVTFEGRHLENRSLATSYPFPIDRNRLTGRANPFRPLSNPQASPNPASGGAVPMPIGAVPAIPAVPAAPAVPAKPPSAYLLKAVMIGPGYPPTALVSVDGRTLLVRLNQALPGNAKVKSIKPDYVTLSVDGSIIRLNLPR